VTAHAVTTDTPRRPDGAGGEEIRMRERGDFSGSRSFCRGTTHARFAGEVERKVSNLVAPSPAERSSSYLRGGNGGSIRRASTPLDLHVRILVPRPATTVSCGEFLLSAKRRHFRRLAARGLARATNFGLLRAGLRHAEWAALLRERRAVDARRVRASHPSPSDLRPSRYFGFHSRASFSASAICAGVIFAATISRRITASVSPLAAAKLNHMCAVT
jgi:hypothetical protein